VQKMGDVVGTISNGDSVTVNEACCFCGDGVSSYFSSSFNKIIFMFFRFLIQYDTCIVSFSIMMHHEDLFPIFLISILLCLLVVYSYFPPIRSSSKYRQWPFEQCVDASFAKALQNHFDHLDFGKLSTVEEQRRRRETEQTQTHG
jgi:hypothetical protein